MADSIRVTRRRRLPIARGDGEYSPGTRANPESFAIVRLRAYRYLFGYAGECLRALLGYAP
eukprot:3374309-Pyramimonas_sp.AAC.1